MCKNRQDSHGALPRLLLQINPSSLDTLSSLKVDRFMAQADEDGYFRKVFRVHPLTAHRRRVHLSGSQEVLEFSVPKFVHSGTPRILRVLGIAGHLFILTIKLALLVVREHITIIRATDPYYCGIIGLGVAALTRKPFCVSLHTDYRLCFMTSGESGAPTLMGSRSLAERVERFVLKRADLVMPIREHLASRAIDNGTRPERIRVIPHGIDVSPFLTPVPPSARQKLGLPTDRPVLSFAGRFSKENFVDHLASLIHILVKVTDNFTLVMAGDGPELERFRSMREEDPIMMRHLVLPGSLPIEDIAELRKLSRVSYCLMGGFSLIESYAAASPVLSYDIDWHSELVRDGETGFLCPMGDIETLAEQTLALLQDEEKAKSMGQKGQALVLAKHTLNAATRTRVLAYEKLLSIHAGEAETSRTT